MRYRKILKLFVVSTILCVMASCNTEAPVSLGGDYYYFQESDNYNSVFIGREIDRGFIIDTALIEFNIKSFAHDDQYIYLRKDRIIDPWLIDLMTDYYGWTTKEAGEFEKDQIGLPDTENYYIIDKGKVRCNGPYSYKEFIKICPTKILSQLRPVS